MLGIPEWLAATLFVVAGLALWFAIALVGHRRGRRRLAAKRPSPSREEFIAMLAGTADPDVAAWLWDQALPYYRPLAPHPDDHLIKDAMIDDDDIAMDWWEDFAGAMGIDSKAPPQWPRQWELTVDNYARWLQSARAA